MPACMPSAGGALRHAPQRADRALGAGRPTVPCRRRARALGTPGRGRLSRALQRRCRAPMSTGSSTRPAAGAAAPAGLLGAPSARRRTSCTWRRRCFGASMTSRPFERPSASPSRPCAGCIDIGVERHGDTVVITVRANAFLHHMVRNIAGALIAVGTGRRPAGWVAELLAGRDRSRGAATAPPQGLYLVRVEYPPVFGVPPPGARGPCPDATDV